MFDIRLTAAVPADAEAILGLYQSQIGFGTSDWDETYPTMAFIEADIAASLLFIARDGADIIAAVSMTFDEEYASLPCWTPAKAVYFARLCVRPALQGRGLAKSVLARAETIARASGADGIRLLCAKTNGAARRLYEHVGYTRCGECAYYDTDFFCFEKKLQKID